MGSEACMAELGNEGGRREGREDKGSGEEGGKGEGKMRKERQVARRQTDIP